MTGHGNVYEKVFGKKSPSHKAYFCHDCGRALSRDEYPYHNPDHSIGEISP